MASGAIEPLPEFLSGEGSMTQHPAVMTGMWAEADLLPAGAVVAVSGGRPFQAAEQAERLLAAGAVGLLSFGTAGGLAPGLAVGTLLVPEAVMVGDQCFACDPAWVGALRRALPQAVGGVMLAATAAVTSPEEKRRLWRQHQVVAVDMESAAVAEACRRAGRPFALLRAVCDPAERPIPPLALAGLGADGRMRPWAVAWGLLRQPGALPGLVRLGRDSKVALRRLAEATAILGPALGLQAL